MPAPDEISSSPATVFLALAGLAISALLVLLVALLHRFSARAIKAAAFASLTTLVSLFVVLYAYDGLTYLSDAGSPFSRTAAAVATTILLVAWAIWVPTVAYLFRRRLQAPVAGAILTAVVLLPTSLLALGGLLSHLNLCNSDISFPISGGSC